MKKRDHYVLVPDAVDFYSGSEEWIELDPGIAFSVQLLNNYGYITVASCSGHYVPKYGRVSEGYIWIQNFPENVPLPPGFTKDSTTLGGSCIRWGRKVKTEEGLKKKWDELEVWAVELPKIERPELPLLCFETLF